MTTLALGLCVSCLNAKRVPVAQVAPATLGAVTVALCAPCATDADALSPYDRAARGLWLSVVLDAARAQSVQAAEIAACEIAAVAAAERSDDPRRTARAPLVNGQLGRTARYVAPRAATDTTMRARRGR